MRQGEERLMLPRLTRAFALGRIALLLPAILSLAVSACGPLHRFDAVPVDSEQGATIPNMPNIRFWGDGDPADLAKMAEAGQSALEREKAYLAATGHTGPLPPVNVLAVSGGGENGAFGAGLL